MKIINKSKIMILVLILFMVVLSASVSAAITCDSGDVDTTCILNHTYYATDGEIISGLGDLIIGTNGSIANYSTNASGTNHGASVILNFLTITIQSGGNISGGNISVVASNLSINEGGNIDSDYLGYSCGNGPSKGIVTSIGGSGGGHGGSGGQNAYGGSGGAVYDSSLEPIQFGSGGGDPYATTTCNGGGIINIVTVDTLTLEGTISSNGQNAGTRAGGGAGGSIYLDSYSLAGSGRVESKGGNGGTDLGGGAGGGRIAVYYNVSTFEGYTKSTVKEGAKGSSGSTSAGNPGTLIFVNKLDGSVIIGEGFNFQNLEGNANETGANNQSFWNSANPSVWNFTNITTYNSTQFYVTAGEFTINFQYLNSTNERIYLHYYDVANTSLNIADSNLNENISNYYINIYGDLNLSFPFKIKNITDSTIITSQRETTLRVLSNFSESVVMDGSTYGSSGSLSRINLGYSEGLENLELTSTTLEAGYINLTLNNLTVDASSYLYTYSLGYPRTECADGSANTIAAGGSHAVKAPIGVSAAVGRASGYAYGSSLYPETAGCGGGNSYNSASGGNGGGSFFANVFDTFELNGPLYAQGSNGGGSNGGGGAGGSIYINTTTFSGSGKMYAHGGNATYLNPSYYGSGGSGGRVAVYYNENTWTGLISTIVKGGINPSVGSAHAGNGTAVLVDKDDGSAIVVGSFIFQNLTTQANESTNISGIWNSDNPLVFNFSVGTLGSIILPTSQSGIIVGSPLGDSNISGDLVQSDPNMSFIANNMYIDGTWSCTSFLTSVNITANNLTVLPGSIINMSACGYENATGPGAGVGGLVLYGGGGGGHGNDGTNGYYLGKVTGGSAYDSSLHPTMFGSGGGISNSGAVYGSGGSGGGLINFIVSDTVTLDGLLLVDGQHSPEITTTVYDSSGAGAGGTIYIETNTLAGSGSLSAVGGWGYAGASSVYGGPGAGGRIAVWYNESSFTGIEESNVTGGIKMQGTGVFVDHPNHGSMIFIDRDNATGIIKDGFSFQGLTGLANESGIPNQSFWDTDNPAYWNFSNLTIISNAQIVQRNSVIIPISTNLGFGNVNWTCNGTLIYLNITQNNLTLTPSSIINMSSCGYANGTGPGAGESSPTGGSNYGGGGGGHGGNGGDTTAAYGGPWEGGPAYGSSLYPTTFGSGGGFSRGGGGYGSGGKGGGVVRLSVIDTLVLGGQIRSDGEFPVQLSGYDSSGGGAGGSILIETYNLEGSGNLTAIGGNGISDTSSVNGANGAGGRIAVYYNTSSFTFSSASANVQAGTKGIVAGVLAERGTAIFVDKDDGQVSIVSSFAFQNLTGIANESGIPNQSFWNTDNPISWNFTNLTIFSESTIRQSSSVYLSTPSLIMDSSNWTCEGTLIGLNVSADNITIGTNSVLDLSGCGHANTTGPGAGIWAGCQYGVGAAYGGDGGNRVGTKGTAYGSALYPQEFGSGGTSGGLSCQYAGGFGGGAIKLSAADNLNVTGNIKANAGTVVTGGRYNYPGAGSGGSILIETENLAGSGIISANSTDCLYYDGDEIAGAGSGGRIAVYYNQSTFTSVDSIDVRGGWCTNNAAARAENGTAIVVDRNDNIGYFVSRFVLQPLTGKANESGIPNQTFWNSENPSYWNFTNFSYSNNTLIEADQMDIIFNITDTFRGDTDDEQSIEYLYISSIRNFSLYLNNKYSIRMIGSTLKTTGNRSFIEIPSLNDSLYILENSTFASNLRLTLNNLTVDSSSYINADALGYGPDEGPGTGSTGSSYVGGAGYGGTGGKGYYLGTYYDTPGQAYGSIYNASNFGSGGETPNAAYPGGAGGGLVSLHIIDTLNNSGLISANGDRGTNAGGYGSGGGSGGGISINVHNLMGSGAFQANGTSCVLGSNRHGGSGSGGRIVVYYNQSSFSGIGNTIVDGGKCSTFTYSIAQNGTAVFVNAIENYTSTVQYATGIENYTFIINNGSESDGIGIRIGTNETGFIGLFASFISNVLYNEVSSLWNIVFNISRVSLAPLDTPDNSITEVTLQTRFANEYNLSDPSLVSLWAFNNDSATTVYDSLGVNNGTRYGSIVDANTGNGTINKGYYFDGINDILSTTNGNNFNFTTDSFTYSAWVNMISVNTVFAVGHIIWWQKDASTYSYLGLNKSGGLHAVADGNSGNVYRYAGDLRNSWHHVAFTYEDGNQHIYVDGVSVASGTDSNTADTIGTLSIGGRPGNTLWFKGSIDEVRIYDRSLSADEVENLYNSGSMVFEDWNEWDSETTMDNGVPFNSTIGGEYMQFKVNLYTNDTNSSPYVSNIDVDAGAPYTASGITFNSLSAENSYSITSFIEVDGTNFTLNDERFTLMGADAYYLADYATNHTFDDDGNEINNSQIYVNEILDKAKALNINVIRTWAQMVGGNTTANNTNWVINESGGHFNLFLSGNITNYNETMFQGLDYVISEASRRDIRVQLVLVNNWDDYGGMNWWVYQSPTTDKTGFSEIPGGSTYAYHDQFYNDTWTMLAFQSYINYTLNRNNTISGIQYKDDPAIFAWLLANEPRSSSTGYDHTLIRNWTINMTAYIKSIDSNHLVGLGIEGFGLDESWGEGTDMISAHNGTGVDFATFELHPDQWQYIADRSENATSGAWQTASLEHNTTIDWWTTGGGYTWNNRYAAGNEPDWTPDLGRHGYQNWVSQNVNWSVNSLGIPVLLQEYALPTGLDPTYSILTDSQKDRFFSNAIYNFYSGGGSGVMMWNLNHDNYYYSTATDGQMDDGFSFYYTSDPTLSAASNGVIDAYTFALTNNTGGTSWVTYLDNYKYSFYYNITTINVDIMNSSLFLNITNDSLQSTGYFRDQMNITEVLNGSINEFIRQFSLDDKDLYWYIEICDNNSLCTTSDPEYLSLSTVPIITALAPENNYLNTTNNTFTLNYTVDDSLGITSCSLYIDGELNQTNNTISSGTHEFFEVTVSTIPNDYVWQIQCLDIGGFTGYSMPMTFIYDDGVFNITLLSPENNTYVNNATQNYTVYINASAPIDTIDFYLGGSIQNSYTDVGTVYAMTYGLVNAWITEGLTNWYYVVTDIFGLSSTSDSWDITYDEHNPLVILTGPLTGYNNTAYLNFTVDISDNLGLENSTLFLYNQTGDLINQTNTTYAEYTLYVDQGFYYNLSTDGNYTWYYEVYDRAGNFNITDNITITIDTTIPNMSFVYPTPNNLGWINVSYITMNITSDDLDINNITINVWNGTNDLINTSNFSLPSFPFNYIIYNIEDGEYSYNVTSFDLSGQYGASETREVYVDTLSPNITLVGPGIYGTSCYQQQTNESVSGDGLCNIYSGLYYNTSLINNAESAVDGNYSTNAGFDRNVMWIYANYTIPANVTSANWSLFLADPIGAYPVNASILGTCLSYDSTTLQVRFGNDDTTPSYERQCYNGTWQTLSQSGVATMYEESITWYIAEYKTNVSLQNFTANFSDNIWYGTEETQYCYQETANVSSGCGDSDTGTYSNDTSGLSGFIYINYTKPNNANSSSTWIVAHGTPNPPTPKSLSIPSDCWDLDADKISFRVESHAELGNSYSELSCLNSTGWKNLSYVFDVSWASVNDDGGIDKFYDGDWNTYTAYESGWGYTSPTVSAVTFLYEEAMNWSMDVAVPVPGPGFYSGVENVTLWIYNSTNSTEPRELYNTTNGTISTVSGVLQAVFGIPVVLIDGFYEWFYQLFDFAGNGFQSENFTLTVDLTEPGMTIHSPINDQTYDNGTVSLNITYNDTHFDNIWFNWNGTDQDYTSVTDIVFPQGNTSIWVYANDTFGNLNITNINFTVDDINLTSCKNLTRANVNYTLQSDILSYSGSVCFNITADNITLDGNNKQVQGINDALQKAIYSQGTNNINIGGFGDINSFDSGIVLQNVNGSSIYNNTLTWNNAIPFYVLNGLGLNITNNTIAYNIISNGIYLRNIINSTILDNNVFNNYAGIWLDRNSSSNTIENNTITSNSVDGLELSSVSSGNNIITNILSSNNRRGLYLTTGSDNNTIRNNTVTSNAKDGVLLDNNISGNIFMNNYISSNTGYEIFDNSSYYDDYNQTFIYNSSDYGEILWIDNNFKSNLTFEGSLIFPGNIIISNNSAYINGSAFTFGLLNNTGLNISLYKPGIEFATPVILKDGIYCTDCTNFTNLNDSWVIFNASGAGNYSIGDGEVYPRLYFVYPTEDASYNVHWNNFSAYTNRDYLIFNLSINDASYLNATIYVYNSTHILINQTNSTLNPFYTNISINSTGEGIYFFNATVWNTWAQSNSTETRNVTVDWTIPNATLNTPLNMTYLNNGTDINFTVNGTDNIGLMQWLLSISNSAGDVINFTSIYTLPEVLSEAAGIMVALADDFYTWFFRVTDLAGNSNITVTRNFTVDTTNPVIVLNSPTNTTYNNETINVDIIVTDTNINFTYYSFDDGATNNTFTAITTEALADGARNITVYAVDFAGNMETLNLNFSVDVTNITYCKNLSRGITYTLAGSITDATGSCFGILSNDSILDGAGYSVDGTSVAGSYGIYGSNLNNITIRNFAGIQEFARGINLASTNGSTVYNNIVSGNLNYDIYFTSASYNNNVILNTLSSTQIPFRADNANNFMVSENTISSVTVSSAMRITGQNNTLRYNVLDSNTGYGMYLLSFHNGTVYNNTATGNSDSGILLSTSNQNQLYSNLLYNNLRGIQITSSYNNILLNNTIYSNTAIDILDTSGPTMNNYLIYNNSYGELKWDSDGFIQNLTTIGPLNFTSNPNIAFNLVSLNASQFTFQNINSSANITLYQTPGAAFSHPIILRDGSSCGSSCYNFTDLSAATVVFNVTSWSNYSIGQDEYYPIECGELDQPNATYYLSANLTGIVGTCFNITAQNVTFNGMGNTINGDDVGSDYAIISQNNINVTIFNIGNISGFTRGIGLLNVNNSIIHSNNILGGDITDGIGLVNSSYNLVYNNTIDDITGIAINIIDNSIYNVIDNNNMYGANGWGSTGIYLESYGTANPIYNILVNNNISSAAFTSVIADELDTLGEVNYLVYNNSYGEIFWTNTSLLSYMNINSNLTFPGDQISISENYIFFNNTDTSTPNGGINSSVNLTLYISTITFNNPQIYKDGALCTDCTNFTALSDATVIFNASTTGLYQILDSNAITACGTLSIPNMMYYLVNDLVFNGTCLNITAENVSVNLAGFTINGDGNDTAVYTYETLNTTVFGGYIIAANIELFHTNNSIIRNLNIIGDTIGILINNGFNNLMESNTIQDLQAAIMFYNGANDNIVVNHTGTNVTYSTLSNITSGVNTNDTLIYRNVFGIYSITNQTLIDELTILGDHNLTIDETIIIGNNSISINATSVTELNGSANLTLYGIDGFGFSDPQIYRDGVICTDCTNFTALDATVVIFNVTTAGNYSIGNSPSTPPTIEFIYPSFNNTQYVNTTYILINASVTGSYYDNVTLYLYNQTLDLINQTNSTESIYFVNISNSGLTNGIYYFNATACNSYNFCNNSETRIVYLDIAAPNLNLTSPGNNTITSNLTVNLTVSINDTALNASVGGIDNVTLYVYNNTGLYNQTSTNYTSGTSTTVLGLMVTLVDNIYTWFYEAFDFAGNGAASHNFTLTIDSIRPVINFVSPTDTSGTVVGRNNTNTNVTVVDLSLINVTTSVYNATGGLISNITNTTSNISFVNFTDLGDGLYYFNATACDYSSNCSSTETRNITIDTETPTIDFISPTETNATNLSRNYIFINANVSDLTIRNITLSLYDSTHTLSDSQTQTYTNPVYYISQNYSYNFSGLADGIYYFNATTCDALSTCNSTETRMVTIDTITPLIQFVTPTNTSDTIVNRSYILINVSVTDVNIQNLSISLYNSSTEALANRANYTSSASTPLFMNTSSLSDGIYYYRAFVNDTAGNTNETELRNITIDTTAPQAVIIAFPQNISYVGTVPPSHIEFSSWDLTASTCWFGNETYNSTPISCGSGTISVNQFVPTVMNTTNGTNHWFAYVRDYNGLLNYSDVYFYYNETPDVHVEPFTPSGAGTSSNGGGFVINFSANVSSDLGTDNVSLWVYNNTPFNSDNLYLYNFTDYPTDPLTSTWYDVFTFIRGIYYWWFEAIDIAGNTFVSNVSNLTINPPYVMIVSPLDGNLSFTDDNTVPLEIASDQVLDYCVYSLDGAANVTFFPNIYVEIPYGDHDMIVYCTNENGTDSNSTSFQLYPAISLGVNIVSPTNGQLYRYPDQQVTWTYNASIPIDAWNYSINSGSSSTITNGDTVTFPLTNVNLELCGTATDPLPAPWYGNFTDYTECDEVDFTVTDQVTGVVTDLMLYFWAFMIAIMLAIIFAYLQSSENMFQFLIRVMWYTGEMVIGFGIIIEAIKFIRTIMGF